MKRGRQTSREDVISPKMFKRRKTENNVNFLANIPEKEVRVLESNVEGILAQKGEDIKKLKQDIEHMKEVNETEVVKNSDNIKSSGDCGDGDISTYFELKKEYDEFNSQLTPSTGSLPQICGNQRIWIWGNSPDLG